MTATRMLALGLLLATLAVVAAGCGKKSEPSATDWASGVCTAITDWRDSLRSAADSVTGGNLSRSSLKSAASDARDATNKLADDLRSLGKPNTQAGDHARQTVDGLSTQIDADVKSIQQAVDSASGVGGALAAVSSVSTTLGTMRDQVTAAYRELSNLDPGGELQDAFKQADSCAPLRNTK